MAPEEEALSKEARELFECYRGNLARKKEQEEALAAFVPLTLREAESILAGAAGISYERTRVQTGRTGDRTQHAALSARELMQKMNRESREEILKGYDRICRDIRRVNASFFLMEEEVRRAARQLYREGRSAERIEAMDGHLYCRRRAEKLRSQAISALCQVLIRERGRKSGQCGRDGNALQDLSAEKKEEESGAGGSHFPGRTAGADPGRV